MAIGRKIAEEGEELSMSNYDLRLDLPALAFINAQLLSLMEKGGTAFDAKKQLFSTQIYATSGLDPYSFRMWNHSLALSLLYCCLVVPREFLDLPQNHSVYREFDRENIRDLFTEAQLTEKSKAKEIDSYWLLRRVRDSVAHGLFSVSESNGEWYYEIWADREPVFRARIGRKNLIDFITKVAHPLVNAVLATKPPGRLRPLI